MRRFPVQHLLIFVSFLLVTMAFYDQSQIIQQLSNAVDPVEILRRSMAVTGLYQTTSFGLSGLVVLDMIYKLQTADPTLPRVEIVFIDTLFHFPETLDLLERVRAQYPLNKIHIFRPHTVNSADEFEVKHGGQLWKRDPGLYDYSTKIEPAERAYADLSIKAVLTGRRRSQGEQRANLTVVDVDSAGLIKINPLFNWSFDQVKQYIIDNNVPHNALLKQGYKSVGDWHSTLPTEESEGERYGRWKGQEKTECGIHYRERTVT